MGKPLALIMMRFDHSRNMFGASAELATGYFKRIQAIADHIAERMGTEAKTIGPLNYSCSYMFGHLDPDLKMDEEELAMLAKLEKWLEPRLYKWNR